MTIRAKFRCQSVTESNYSDGNKYSETVVLSAVYSSDPTSENYSWSVATPCGSMTMTISNPGAWGAFVAGQDYFIDLNKAS